MIELNKIKLGQTFSVKAGWDGVQWSGDVMELLKQDYPSVEWLLKDKNAAYGLITQHKDYAVALIKIEKHQDERWVYVKIMDGISGPFQRPPSKFWDLPQVKKVLHPDYIALNKNATHSDGVEKISDEVHKRKHEFFASVKEEKNMTAGFAISTSPEDMIEQNAKDSEIELTKKEWEVLNKDMSKIESNVIKHITNKYHVQIRDEGHDNDSDLIGSIFFKSSNKKAAEYFADHGKDNEDQLAGAAGAVDIFHGVSEIGAKIIDVSIYFFNIEEEK
jgi:hypothetical protein